jgi:PleD family two-component response regulator
MGTGQAKQSTIFLIEEDDETRVVLRQSLTRSGYHLSVAIDEEDAMDRVSDGRMRADMILINVVGHPVQEILHMGRRIRERAQLDGNTALVVMAEKYDKDLEGTDENVGGNDWIFYLGEDPDQLQNFLRRLTPT